MNLDWRLNKGEGPLWNGLRLFENSGLNLLFNVASGTPYTPTQVFNEVTLAAVSNIPSGPLNSRYGPWSLDMDLKATREFHARGLRLEAYAWVLNVLNQKNPTAVYTSSGSPATTDWLGTNEGQGFLSTAAGRGVDGAALYGLAENDPTIYSNPRLVRFGLRTNF